MADPDNDSNLSGPYCVASTDGDVAKSGKNLFQVITAFFVASLCWPICYYFNHFYASLDPQFQPLLLTVTRLTFLSVFFGIVALTVRNCSQRPDYGIQTVWWTSAGFLSNIAFFGTLEHDGTIQQGYMHFYLEFGETLLSLGYGLATALLDALLYLIITYQMSRGKTAQYLLAFWATGWSVNLAIIFGGFAANSLATANFILLNIPYVILPPFILYRGLVHKKAVHSHGRDSKKIK